MTQYQTSVLNNILNAKNSSKKELHTSIFVMQNHTNLLAEFVYEIVASLGEGFVVDIAKKALEAATMGKQNYITEKQAWCIVYAFVKISDKAIAEWYEAYCEQNANEAEETAEAEENIEEVDGNEVIAEREIRKWNYSADHHILNVHFANNKQHHCHVHPKEMRPVFKAVREKQNALELLIKLLDLHPHESYEQKTLAADDERFVWLAHKQTVTPLNCDEEKEFHKLINQDTL